MRLVFYQIIITMVTTMMVMVSSITIAEEYHWDKWQRLPVFDTGRTMPLNTFARLVVTDITGVPRPFLQRDELLITGLATGKFVIPSSEDTTAEREQAEKEHHRWIAARIEQLIPATGKRFEAHELLLGWMLEPDVWEFIPFFDVSTATFRADVLGVPYNERLTYAAPFQVDISREFHRRLESIRKRLSEGDGTPQGESYDALTLKLRTKRLTFADLVFDPTCTRSVSFEKNIRNGSEAFANMTSLWQRLTASPTNPNMEKVRMEWSTAFGDIGSELLLLSQMSQSGYGHGGQWSAKSLADTESQLEKILEWIRPMRQKSESLITVAFSDDETNTVELPVTVDELRRQKMETFYFCHCLELLDVELQSAFLSLYAQGRTVRLLPTLHPGAILPDKYGFGGDGAGMGGTSGGAGGSPWLSFRMLETAGETALRRFAIQPEEMSDTSDTTIIHIQAAIAQMKKGYSTGDVAVFNTGLDQLATSLRAAGYSFEEYRRTLVPDSIQNNEALRKTEYPRQRAINVEYRYTVMDSFFWMWVYCAGGIGAVAVSLVFEVVKNYRRV